MMLTSQEDVDGRCDQGLQAAYTEHAATESVPVTLCAGFVIRVCSKGG